MEAESSISAARIGLALLALGVVFAGACGDDDLKFPGNEAATPTVTTTATPTATETPSS